MLSTSSILLVKLVRGHPLGGPAATVCMPVVCQSVYVRLNISYSAFVAGK